MYQLYSKRKKDAEGNPEIFIYESFSTTFRNQFFAIVDEVFQELEKNISYMCYRHESMVMKLCKNFAQEKGLKYIPGGRDSSTRLFIIANSIEALERYIDNCNDEDFLDLVDYVCYYFNELKEDTSKYELIERAIEKLNYRFQQNSLGYQAYKGQIIVKTNTVTHEKIVKPALKLLLDEEFRGSEDEYLSACENYRNRKNKDAIVDAAKAFESTMKTICSGMGYAYNKNNDTAKTLLNILKNNNFFPSYLENHMNGIRTTLESGAPTVRNKTSGHGQGKLVQNVPDEYVEYTLNLVATNIVFLCKLYQKKKEEETNK